MKTSCLKKIVPFILMTLLSLNTKAQTDFYYAYGDSVEIYQDTTKYLINYPNGLYDSEVYPGEKLPNLLYEITYEELSNIGSYGASPLTFRIFKTEDGLEIGESNQLLIKFKDGVTTSQINDLIQTYGLTYERSGSTYDLYTVNNALSVSHSISEGGLVTYCIVNFLSHAETHTNDEYFDKQFYLKNTGQLINDGHSGTVGADINIEPAWSITKGDSSIIIAVIDHAFSDHPDLPYSRQVLPKGCNISNYGGFYNPDTPKIRFPSVQVHGNACMGIIAATHDNEGIAGIAPNCKIMTIGVDIMNPRLPKSDYVDAINMAVDSGAKVLSCSWGYTTANPYFYPPITDAIQRALDLGMSVVFSASNSANSSNYGTQYPLGTGYVSFPACSKFVKQLITVGATDRNDEKSNYSPYSSLIDICAPSSKSYHVLTAGEAQEMWTIDYENADGYNLYNDTVDQKNPNTNTYLPQMWEMLPNYGTDSLNYTGRFTGTSAAAPQVAGTIALMNSVNPCIDPYKIKDILLNTAKKVSPYYYNVSGHSNYVGYGRMNAGEAVFVANGMHHDSLDLYIKDHRSDFGFFSTLGAKNDNSPDIWVRRQKDGFVNQFHENPIYSVGAKAYVYIRVRNKSCTSHDSATQHGQLALFYNQSNTVNAWPSTSWSQITYVNLPDIPYGRDTIIEIEWTLPTPSSSSSWGWNVCLLGRIQNLSSDPYINYTPNLSLFVGNNNNVALKNLSMISAFTDQYKSVPGVHEGQYYPHGNFVDIGNPYSIATDFDFTFEVTDIETTISDITEAAEVKIIFDPASWTLFSSEGAFSQSGVTILGENMIAITSPSVTFSDITIPANTIYQIYVGASFWAEEISEYDEFQYHLRQKRSSDDSVEGVQNFQMFKGDRDPFSANITPGSVTINQGENTTLSAVSIGGASPIYNWLNPDGSIEYTGQNFSASPVETTTYKLQAISNPDGFMDYSSVTVEVKKKFINSLNPNPVDDLLTVEYQTENATTASIQIVSAMGGTPETFTIDVNETSTLIDVSNFSAGNYIVSLICDAVIEDSENLLIQ